MNYKRKRIIFISSIFVLSVFSLLFIVINFKDNIVFFYSPSELRQINIINKITDKKFRVGGLVVKGSINKINATNTEFLITDNKEELLVKYTGILPNLFREEQGVVAKGRLNINDNIFYSTELLVKHDEKYVPPEIKSLEISQ